ncbi:hypothetical protein Sjap_021917 [Stephania japonica]|uniref:Uncharacterized protein n=1 Tax=Stephania japonica TaxID=461633 RepID=A0AAP0HUJ8_9MAGN
MEAYRLCFTLSATTKLSFRRRPSPSQNPLKSISAFIPLSSSISSTSQNPFFPPSPNKTFTKLCSTRRPESFDEAAFEAERLTLDAKARKSMAEISEQETAMRSTDAESDSSVGEDEKAWKWRIRKRVWDLMEAENIAHNPRPVHHRIPNFVGAADAAKNLGGLEVFKLANCVKVNPDSPQKQVRFLTLSGGKKLLTPQPRLRTGFFSVLELSMLAPGTINEACTSVGVAKHGRPIGLDEKIKVDLIVIGSVAVDPKTGARLGKGEVTQALLNLNTECYGIWKPLVTQHQLSLLVWIYGLRVYLLEPNDYVGIYWEKLSPEKLSQIRILRELKQQIERETGTKLPCGPSEKLPPTAKRNR